MNRSSIHRACAILVAFTVALSTAWAAPIPSSGEDLGSRSADRRIVEDFVALEKVADALSELGLEIDEVESRLDQLSDEDLRHLASNLDQIQAAGEQVPEYIWWLAAGLLGVLILVAIF